MLTKIVYEDAEILVCDKPAGIAVESASAQEADVVSELKNYLASSSNGEPYLGVVHRLDQPVRGLLVFGKTPKAAASLSSQLVDHRMQKFYRAKVFGIMVPEDGYYEHMLYKDSKSNMSYSLDADTKIDNRAVQPKKARLEYHCDKVVKTDIPGQIYSDVNIQLFTGRHHQIRVQFATVGHPLLGDLKYGTPESIAMSKEMNIRTPALCANKLVFEHPRTLDKMTFALPPEEEKESISE